MVILVVLLHEWTEHLYDRNGNTSEYCSIRRQHISTTGMVILVNTASLVDRTSVRTTGMVILVSTALLEDRTSVQQEW